MRYLKLLLLAVFSLVLLNGWMINPVFAEEKVPAYQVRIIDHADLLTDAEEKQLAEQLENLVQYGNMVFYTTKLPKGTNYEKHSEDTYYRMFANQPGVIFQIDMGNRKLTLSTSAAADKVLAPERDSIVDNIYEYATAKNYYKCASECFRQIEIIFNDGEIAHDMKHINNGIIALVLGLILNLWIICATSRTSASKAKEKLLGKLIVGASLTNVVISEGKVIRRYKPRKSSSGGGGGGSSGGGGGGFSGGSSSHGF